MSQENQKQQIFGYMYDKKDWSLIEIINRPSKKEEFIEVMMRVSDNKLADGEEEKWKGWFPEVHGANEALVQATMRMYQESGLAMSAADEHKLVQEGPFGGGKRRKTSVPKRYVPKQLSKKDKKKQARELKKSRKAYKKGKYHTRKKMKSFKSKVSPHIIKARKMYKIDKIKPTRKLAKATRCKLKGLKRMFKKGQGAYFSSGSRPNQTGHSWGYARMASAITGGKASAVDFKIIQENCSKKSRAYKLAKKAYKKYKKGRRRVKQVQIGGRRMKESIVKFKRGPYPKKYTAIVKNKKNKKTRKIHFGDRRYQQYKDRTPLKLYKSKNHNTRKRMQNYFNRHSGTKKRGKAIKKEKNKSRGKYNAKILSHVYLW